MCCWVDEKKGKREVFSRENKRDKEQLVAIAEVPNLKPLQQAYTLKALEYRFSNPENCPGSEEGKKKGWFLCKIFSLE